MDIYNLKNISGVIGQEGKCPYGRRWYEVFIGGFQRLDKMNEEIPFSDDPDWLTLPLAKREDALRRREAMLEYEAYSNPGEAEAIEAAHKIGVSTGQFYRLRRQWQKRRSIFSLIPFGRPGIVRKPKLDPEITNAVRALIVNAVESDGIRSPAEILRRIQRGWALDKQLPSHMTLRKNIAETISDIEDVSGPVDIGHHVIPEALDNAPQHYGEMVAIDHVGLQIFVAQELGPTAPLLTLAIDLFTSSICGYHLSARLPGPDQVVEVIKNMEERTWIAADDRTEQLHPRLIVESGPGSSWQDLVDRLRIENSKHGLRSNQRAVRFGTITHRLIGRSLGDLLLAAPQQFPFRSNFERETDALVSASELANMITDAVSDLNEKRIPSEIKKRAMRLRL